MKRIKISAKCKIVTPMLSSGAEQRKFEIRATSVKAGLRFWWRAFQPHDIPTLRKKEAAVFGSTDGSCPFRISVHDHKAIQCWSPGDQVVDSEETAKMKGFGLAYVFFSIMGPARRNQPIKLKPWHADMGRSGRSLGKPGGTFRIQIHFRPEKQENVAEVLCALWLLENLGGIGGRTRRGAGCFEITSLKINDRPMAEARLDQSLSGIFQDDVPFFFPSKGQSPEDFIHRGIDVIRGKWQTTNRKDPVLYTCMGSKNADILVCHHPKAASATRIMDIVGKQTMQFCDTYPYNEACQMHSALSNQTPLSAGFSLEKAAKGLPIIYNFTNKFDQRNSGRLTASYTATTVKCDAQGKPIKDNNDWVEGCGRRASPLLISCHEKGGTPYAVICHFPAPMVPGDEKIWLKSSLRNDNLDKLLDPPSTAPFGQFVTDLIFNEKQFNDRHGETQTHSPLVAAFSQCFRIVPFEKIPCGSPVQDPDPPATPPPSPHPPIFSTEIDPWLRRVDNLRQDQAMDMDFIMDALDEFDANGFKGQAHQLALALEAKLKSLGTWKKHPRKNEIEYFLKQ